MVLCGTCVPVVILVSCIQLYTCIFISQYKELQHSTIKDQVNHVTIAMQLHVATLQSVNPTFRNPIHLFLDFLCHSLNHIKSHNNTNVHRVVTGLPTYTYICNYRSGLYLNTYYLKHFPLVMWCKKIHKIPFNSFTRKLYHLCSRGGEGLHAQSHTHTCTCTVHVQLHVTLCYRDLSY